MRLDAHDSLRLLLFGGRIKHILAHSRSLATESYFLGFTNDVLEIQYYKQSQVEKENQLHQVRILS